MLKSHLARRDDRASIDRFRKRSIEDPDKSLLREALVAMRNLPNMATSRATGEKGEASGLAGTTGRGQRGKGKKASGEESRGEKSPGESTLNDMKDTTPFPTGMTMIDIRVSKFRTNAIARKLRIRILSVDTDSYGVSCSIYTEC